MALSTSTQFGVVSYSLMRHVFDWRDELFTHFDQECGPQADWNKKLVVLSSSVATACIGAFAPAEALVRGCGYWMMCVVPCTCECFCELKNELGASALLALVGLYELFISNLANLNGEWYIKFGERQIAQLTG
ncbi:MAG: hypothetical protein S4CHLAM102_05850 [Chlamydiia bacterium]|nr:hypothetical protein [Chlamydiia bacterium]